MAAPIASVVWCCCGAGTGSGGRRVSDGDTANHSEIMAPAAALTPPIASSLITCMAGIMYPFVASK